MLPMSHGSKGEEQGHEGSKKDAQNGNQSDHDQQLLVQQSQQGQKESIEEDMETNEEYQHAANIMLPCNCLNQITINIDNEKTKHLRGKGSRNVRFLEAFLDIKIRFCSSISPKENAVTIKSRCIDLKNNKCPQVRHLLRYLKSATRGGFLKYFTEEEYQGIGTLKQRRLWDQLNKLAATYKVQVIQHILPTSLIFREYNGKPLRRIICVLEYPGKTLKYERAVRNIGQIIHSRFRNAWAADTRSMEAITKH
mmetsp:Transcript_22721/g.40135  ORF Transcript_22721/g.40135 Transcript_22721/m.40135 type:complete len:252 (+) Transcript_22721:125-880(+)